MARLTRKGSDAKGTAKPAKIAPPKVHPVDAPIDWDDPYADVFPDPSGTPANERISWLSDGGLWCQQWIGDTAALARKLDTLTRQLHDPKLADNPHRPDAVRQARAWEAELHTLVRDIQWHEAHCDRAWQSLTPRERAPCAGHWQTSATTPRLIGAAFLRLGTFETWPRFFRIRRSWFADFPPLLILDMKNAGLWAWRPMPDPPDPFGGDVIIDTALARELERHT